MAPRITIYHWPPSRSVRVFWLLEELGLPYEMVRADWPYLKYRTGTKGLMQHPLGQLPYAEIDGDKMFESGAILQLILERYGEGRLEPPVDSPLRGDFLKWMWFSEATLSAALNDLLQHTQLLPDEMKVPGVCPLAKERSLQRLAVVEAALAGKEWLLGDLFSAADVMMGYSLNHAINRLKIVDPQEMPNVSAYFGRLSARPAFQKAFHVDEAEVTVGFRHNP